MKNPLKKLLPFLWKTKWHLKDGHEVSEQFTHDDIVYYAFVNEQRIPAERAFAALDIYTELEQRTDATYHLGAYNTIIEFLKKGDNIKAGIVASNAIQRMQHITNADLLYKLASVYYFDKNENCYSYDYEYAEKKINRWKKDKNIEAFFLKTPLKEYLPSFDSYNMNLNTYTKEQRKELIRHLRLHLSVLLDASKESVLISKLESQVTTLENLVNLDG